MINPKCPYCQSDRTNKHGITTKQKKKTQRYKCKDCGRTFGGNKVGRPPQAGGCSICGEKIHAKGLCNTHYQLMWKKFKK